MSTVTSMERAAPVSATPAPAPRAAPWTDAWRERLEAALRAVVGPVAGFALFVLVWQVVAMRIPEIPTPGETWQAAVALFADPFYRQRAQRPGHRLERAGLAAARRHRFWPGGAGGDSAGLSPSAATRRCGRCSRPSSACCGRCRPLAWLPIGLLVFKGANPAAIWTIFICSIWPMIINTAVGVQRVPQDYLNVARVLKLSEWKVTTKVLLPAVLPYMLTGVRLSIGTAWLVIVAAEMLTGGVGIGFWIWDEWNNLNVEHILIAIFVIGIVGLLLERVLVALASRFTYTEE